MINDSTISAALGVLLHVSCNDGTRERFPETEWTPVEQCLYLTCLPCEDRSHLNLLFPLVRLSQRRKIAPYGTVTYLFRIET